MSSWVAVSEDDSDEEFATGPHHLHHHHHAGDGPGADGADLGRDGGGGEGVRGGAAAFESERETMLRERDIDLIGVASGTGRVVLLFRGDNKRRD